MDSTKQILIKNRVKELLPLLKEDSFKDIDEFFSASVYQKIPHNKIISVEGDACNYFSFLLKGIIRVYKVGSSGREITLYRINEGGSCILTASCILSHKAFPAIAVTELDCEVLSLPANLFKDWVTKYSFWQEYVFDLVSTRLSDVITTVEEIAFKSVDTRIAEKLTHLSGEKGIFVEITHNEIARDIGTSREVVSRILKDFESRGVIQIARGSIKILDTIKLAALQKK